MGTSADSADAVSTWMICATLGVAAAAGLCSPRQAMTMSAAASTPIQPLCFEMCERRLMIRLPLAPTAAERGIKIDQRLQVRVLHLNQRVLRAEERVLGVEHRQYVDRAGGHLRLRELVRAPCLR